MLDRVNGGQKLYGTFYLSERGELTYQILDPQYLPFSLHVKKFVVGGGGAGKSWILILSFRPKLNNFL